MTETPTLRDAGGEAFDHHVGAGCELVDPGATGVGAEVGGDALLPAVPHQEPGGVLMAEPVALRWFHLEHPGAVVREQHARERRTDAARTHLDHLQAVADPSGHSASPRRWRPLMVARGTDIL